MTIHRGAAVITALLVLGAGCGRYDVRNGATSTPMPAAEPFTPVATAPEPTLIDVADPRPGDLRTDADADVLPPGYVAGTGVYAAADVAYGPDPAQVLDLYLPGATDAPVVLFLHSGGWVGGDEDALRPMVLRFVERGYAVASVSYRLAPDHIFPAQIHDVKLAIRWLKLFGETYGLIDGDRIVVYGISAGGHLAAFVAATPGRFEPSGLAPELATFDSSVVGIVSVVGPTDLVDFYRQPHPWALPITEAMVGCSPCADAQLAEASPITHLGPSLPPAYWAYGGLDDDFVHWSAQGVAIASAWGEQAGPGSSWLDVIDDQGHNIDHTTINQRAVEEFVDLATGVRS